MNGIARLSLTGLLMVALAACGAPPADEEEEAEVDPDSQRAEKTVFDDMIQTQDRARAVEGTLMDSKRDLDTAIDHAEDDTAEDDTAE